jgi:sensor histidine kinase YesM
MQLEPHFLFNTLNAITTLAELDRQREALTTLSNLNAILKATLKRPHFLKDTFGPGIRDRPELLSY